MATIYIDNKPYEVNPEQNLLHECLSLGFDLPYFCWHPALCSVGACRQCAVKQFRDENDKRGKIVMACMTPASEGTRISIDDPEAKAFRASVIEWLMLNHPHDCPVCDEGGVCHLQDMTVMTGHDYRRTPFKKRTYRNQDLGPFINHEMNRCIQCYRCVRYYRDYAGGRDFDVFGAHDHVYFGRHEDGVLENEFSGNLVEVCPTGVFTDKTLGQHYTRKWDMQGAPSVCVHCGLGCNTSPKARYGMLRRIVNRFNLDINGYFLCDRGRFGYEFVNSGRRLRKPWIRSNKSAAQTEVSGQAIIDAIKSILVGGGKVFGVGSPRASLEANYALRSLVGPDRFCSGMSAREANLISAALEILRKGPAQPASLHDVESSDAVFVLGEDLLNAAPRVALALRQSVRQKPMEIADKLKIPRWHDYAVRTAVQDEKGPLILATPYSTKLDDIASLSYRAAPDDLARLGFGIANAINPEAPPVPGQSDEMKELAQNIARLLVDARQPVIISGTGCGTLEVLQAAANVASALCEKGKERARLCFAVPECNSIGLGMLRGATLDDAAEKAGGKPDAIIVLENDLYRREPASQIDKILGDTRVIAIDALENETTLRADAFLPAGTFAESEGTLVNNEGRAQRYFRVLPPEGEVRESWRWLRDMMVAAGTLEANAWLNLDEVTAALEAEISELKHISQAAPPASYRFADQKIPRQPHRYSGRTAMNANVSVHEPAPPADPDSALSFSMEGYQGRPPAGLASFFWAPGWNSYQAINRYQTGIGGPLHEPAGIRLITAGSDSGVSYFKAIPESFSRRDGELLFLRAYNIFGTEELSSYAPGVASRAVKPYLGISSLDAAELSVSGGAELEIALGNFSAKLAVKTDPSLPRGVAVLPVGLPGLTGIDLPAWGRLKV